MGIGRPGDGLADDPKLAEELAGGARQLGNEGVVIAERREEGKSNPAERENRPVILKSPKVSNPMAFP